MLAHFGPCYCPHMHEYTRMHTVQNIHASLHQSVGTILVMIYDLAGTTIRHWFCHFHVLQAWRKNIKAKYQFPTKATSLPAHARSLLRSKVLKVVFQGKPWCNKNMLYMGWNIVHIFDFFKTRRTCKGVWSISILLYLWMSVSAGLRKLLVTEEKAQYEEQVRGGGGGSEGRADG